MDKNKNRNLILLLSSIIKLIPDDETQFKMDLEKIRNKCCFTDPEVMYNMWVESQSIISDKFESMPILPEWTIQFINIWTNKN